MKRIVLVVLLLALGCGVLATVTFVPGGIYDWISLEYVEQGDGTGDYVSIYKRRRFGKHKGLIHGRYRVESTKNGAPITLGQFVNGTRVGVWTYREEDGTQWKQVRYERGERVEVRREPPWWPSPASEVSAQ